MQKYIKNYINYFNYGEQDKILCEACGGLAVDLHHVIYRSQGGSDDVSNIIALCRPDHEKAHKNILTKEQLQKIHNKYLTK